MFAMFPRDPSVLTFGMPHCGLTPTGAEAAFEDKPVRAEGSLWSSLWGYRERLDVTDGSMKAHLAVEEIAPRIRWNLGTQALKVAKPCHGRPRV